jgi:arylsulfatase A-like enzyme
MAANGPNAFTTRESPAMRTIVAVIFLCFVLPSCKPSGEGGPILPQESGPNLVLISLDTLRADHLSCYGYERQTSPHIDRFAESAWLFVNTTSPSGQTTEAHMSMFTGLYPSVHRIRTSKLAGSLRVLDPSIPTLASHLKERGLTTVGFHGGGNVDSIFGFDRGFDKYERAGIDQAIEWLSSQAKTNRFFLFFHTYATHDPYTPQPPYDTTFGAAYHGSIIHDEAELERLAGSDKWPKVSKIFWQNVDRADPQDVARLVDLYDGEIVQLDAELQKLFAAIESWAPNTVVVVLSDLTTNSTMRFSACL